MVSSQVYQAGNGTPSACFTGCHHQKRHLDFHHLIVGISVAEGKIPFPALEIEKYVGREIVIAFGRLTGMHVTGVDRVEDKGIGCEG